MICVGILRGLPALTSLSLHAGTMPIVKFIFDKSGFSVLKYFRLKLVKGLAWLRFEEDAMPSLLKLKLVFNVIPQIDKYEHGIISIDHMSSIREICVKFGGAATGREHALVSNHQSNPIINRQSTVYNSFDDKSTNQKLQTYEILKGERDEIVEKERDDHGKESKSPVDQRILRSPVSSSRPHVPDVSFQGRGRVGQTGPPISASLGAMRTLVWKLDMLLLAPPPGSSSESVKLKMQLLIEDVEEISSCLDTLSQLEDPPQTARCWMNEVRDLSYNMEDYINSLYVQPGDPSLIADNIKIYRSHHKWLSHVRVPKKLTWDEQIVGSVSEFRIYVGDAMKRHRMYGLNYFSTLRRTLVPVGHMLPTPTPYEVTSDIVINDRMNEFINSLTNDGADQQQLKVVSVLGSACLGKTTFVRVLYKRIGLQFDCRAFI